MRIARILGLMSVCLAMYVDGARLMLCEGADGRGGAGGAVRAGAGGLDVPGEGGGAHLAPGSARPRARAEPGQAARRAVERVRRRARRRRARQRVALGAAAAAQRGRPRGGDAGRQGQEQVGTCQGGRGRCGGARWEGARVPRTRGSACGSPTCTGSWPARCSRPQGPPGPRVLPACCGRTQRAPRACCAAWPRGTPWDRRP